MADAEVTKVSVDPHQASAFLEQARGFLNDAAGVQMGRASRQVLAHNAAIAACDSVLAINGFQVEGSDGGHALRLDKAEALLGGDLEDLFQQLDSVRLTRADASYRAAFVPESQVEEAVQAVTQLVGHVEDHVLPQVPDRPAR